jgi:hypothetical protein
MPHLSNEIAHPLRYFCIHVADWESFKRVFLPKTSEVTPGTGRMLPINLESGHVLDLLNICFPKQFFKDIQENKGEMRLYVKQDPEEESSINFKFVTQWPGHQAVFSGTISARDGLSIIPDVHLSNQGNEDRRWGNQSAIPADQVYQYLLAIDYFDPYEGTRDQANPELLAPDWNEIFYVSIRPDQDDDEFSLQSLKEHIRRKMQLASGEDIIKQFSASLQHSPDGLINTILNGKNGRYPMKMMVVDNQSFGARVWRKMRYWWYDLAAVISSKLSRRRK